MICPSCGKQINDSSKFCPYCGRANAPQAPQLQTPQAQRIQPRTPAPQPQLQAQPPQAPLPQAPFSPEPPKKNKNGLLIGLIVALSILLLAIIVVIVLLFNQKKSPASTSSSRNDSRIETEKEPAEAEEEETSEGIMVSGQLFDQNTGDPLKGVTVLLLRKNDDERIMQTETDDEGKFVFSNVTEGIYSLVFESDQLPEIITEELEVGPDSSDYIFESSLAVNRNYYEFLAREIIPEYGLADTETHSESVNGTDFWPQYSWDKRDGIAGAASADLDGDGKSDFIVLRFGYILHEYTGNDLLVLFADCYCRDSSGEVYLAGSQQLLECPSFDVNEYRVSLVPCTDGTTKIMAQNVHYRPGVRRMFTDGATNDIRFFAYDGTTFASAGSIHIATAGDNPYFFTIPDQDSVYFSTMAEALTYADIPLQDEDVQEPFFNGDFHYVLLLDYLLNGEGDYKSAVITTELYDYTELGSKVEGYIH